MTDQSLRRADDLLTELVELVETARAVPISGACMVPREHTLDLLDARCGQRREPEVRTSSTWAWATPTCRPRRT